MDKFTDKIISIRPIGNGVKQVIGAHGCEYLTKKVDILSGEHQVIRKSDNKLWLV